MQRFRAQGSTRAEAQANARLVKYSYVVQDSTVRFDDAVEMRSRFRAQDLDMDVLIPYEKPFRMTAGFARYIRNEFGERELNRMGSSLWKFTKSPDSDAGQLVCLNYPREKDRDNDSEDDDVTDLTDDVQGAVAGELGDDFDDIGSNTRQFTVGKFSKVDVGGAFVVRFRRGETYKVVADGREEDLDDVKVDVDGNTLNVSVDRRGVFDWGNRQRIGLTITVPAIDALKLSGASKASLTGFGDFANLDLELNGACRTVFDGEVNNLNVSLSGASNAVLRGHASRLEAGLNGASKIEATGMRVDRASVDASGASHADLGEVGSLDSETSGASKVTRQ